MCYVQPALVHAIRFNEIGIAEVDVAQQFGKLAILIVLWWYDNQIRAGLPGFPIGLSSFHSSLLCEFTLCEDDAVALFR